MKPSIAILTGGTSSEREIALQSAKTIQAALADRFDVTVFDFPSQIDDFVARRIGFAAAIPVFHGRGGEDGTVQGFLTTLGIPFIFSDVQAHAVAIDKALTKKLVALEGVRTSPGELIRRGETVVWDGPAVVKPVDGGSSIGTAIVKNETDLPAALAAAFERSDRALVEKFVEGREFTVGIVEENGKNVALPVIEIRSKNPFFDYQSKYDAALAEEFCPAPIEEELASRLQNAALLAHKAVGARHLSRSDFIVDADGQEWFLEINTIPGQTANSLVPKAIRASGRDFGSLLAEWVSRAG